MSDVIKSANPYLPLWEHVPDGEPRVFEYEGEKRIYIYGSHDTLRTEYCGPDQVVWSAPVNDLTDWKYHGVCYEVPKGDVLYAPDVVQKGDTFYMYAAQEKGSKIVVAKSKTPWGPFTDPVVTELGFDPGVLVDDDGRVYAYWGFSGCCCAELNDDMATIKPGTFHDNPIGHAENPWIHEREHINYEDGFFEASSPRKVLGKYVYIYSKMYNKPNPQQGVFTRNNGFLSYKVSDKPLEDFAGGGDISFNGGEIIEKADGTRQMTYQWGNNHGSLMEIEGQWYIFYHRQTGNDEYSRQGMIEPVEVELTEDGQLLIGKIIRDESGKAIGQTTVEMTSQGANVNGLDGRCTIPAAYACHLYNDKLPKDANGVYDYQPSTPGKAYIAPTYGHDELSPIEFIQDGCTVGFKYIQMGDTAPKKVFADIVAKENITVNVRTDSYQGDVVATSSLAAGATGLEADISAELTGKKAIYFEFVSDSDKDIASFTSFRFE